jgi:hypothetical protein
VNDQRSASLTSTTLVASAATGQYATLAPQYRFQVFNDAGTLVQDSGLVAAPTWTIAITLTPLKRYTWKVRAEYQGRQARGRRLRRLRLPSSRRPTTNRSAAGRAAPA